MGSGTIGMTDASGAIVAGSGAVHVDKRHVRTDHRGPGKPVVHRGQVPTGSDTITINTWDQAGLDSTVSINVSVTPALTGPVITAPTTESATAGATIAIAGVSVADAFAAGNPGTMALNLSVTSGTIGMTGAGGAIVAGSGAQSMSISGTFAQVNADLANLSYTAAGTAGSDTISVNIWDQAGLDFTMSINVSVTPAPPAPVVIAASPLITASNAKITATAGNHTTFAGNGDAISALGGTETAMAFLGSDPLAWQHAGYGNDEIHRHVLRSPDLFNFWPLPAVRGWSSSAATAHDFANPMVNLVAVTPGNTATFHDFGSLSLLTPLAHVVT